MAYIFLICPPPPPSPSLQSMAVFNEMSGVQGQTSGVQVCTSVLHKVSVRTVCTVH